MATQPTGLPHVPASKLVVPELPAEFSPAPVAGSCWTGPDPTR